MRELDVIVAEHLEWIARLAFRFCRDKYDAEDLAQETLCRILTHRDKYDVNRDFRPWALVVMSNIYKTWQTRKSCVCFGPLDDATDYCASPERTDSRVLLHDVLRTVRNCARLTVGVECVLLYAKGYSYDEISDIAGIKAGTVKSRIATGRAVIARMLRDAPY